MVSVLPWILVFLVANAAAMPSWPPFHAPRHTNAPPPPLHRIPSAPPTTSPQLDTVDKCLFTCDHCYKHPQALIACANECIMSGGETLSMEKIWLQTCPQFLMPIYFDYQQLDLPLN